MYKDLNLDELQKLISETIESLPEKEAQKLREIQESSEDLSLQTWMLDVNKYVNELVANKHVASPELTKLKQALAILRPSRLNKRVFQIVIILLILAALAVKYYT